MNHHRRGPSELEAGRPDVRPLGRFPPATPGEIQRLTERLPRRDAPALGIPHSKSVITLVFRQRNRRTMLGTASRFRAARSHLPTLCIAD